jgi:hypothetical protein
MASKFSHKSPYKKLKAPVFTEALRRPELSNPLAHIMGREPNKVKCLAIRSPYAKA